MGERRTISRNKISRGKRSRYRETKTKSKKYKRSHKGGARIKRRSVGRQRGAARSAKKFATKAQDAALPAAVAATALGAAAGAGSGLMTGVGAGVGATAGAVAGAAVVPAAGLGVLGLGLAAGTVAAVGGAGYAFYLRFANLWNIDFPKYQAAIGPLKYKQTLDGYLRVKAKEEAGEEAGEEEARGGGEPPGIYKVVDKNAPPIKGDKYYILWVRHGKSHSNEGQDLYKTGKKNASRIFETTAEVGSKADYEQERVEADYAVREADYAVRVAEKERAERDEKAEQAMLKGKAEKRVEREPTLDQTAKLQEMRAQAEEQRLPDVTVEFTEGGSIGLDLKETKIGDNYIVEIKRVKESTQAVEHKALVPGLVVTSVAGRSVVGEPLDDVIKIINDHPQRPIGFVFKIPVDQIGGSRAAATEAGRLKPDDSQTLNNMRLFSMEDRYKKIFELMKSPQNMEQYLSNKESDIDADGSGVYPIDIGTQGKGLSSPTFFPPKESSMYLHPPGLSTVGSIQAVMAGEGIRQLFENNLIACKLNKTICTSCIPRAALTAKLISCGLSGLGEDKFVEAEKRIQRIYGIGEKRAIDSEKGNYYARSFTRGHTSMSGSDSSLWEGTGDPKDISLNMSNNYMKKFNELYPMFPIDEDTGSIVFTETIEEHREAMKSSGDCKVMTKGTDKEAEIFQNIVRKQCSQGAVTVIACHGDFMKKKILKGADKMFLHSTNNCDAVLVEYDPGFITEPNPELVSQYKKVIQRFDLRLPKDFDDLLTYHKKTLSLVGETTPAETTPDQGDVDSIKFALRCEALNMQIQNVSYRPLQKEMKERQEILKEVMGFQTIAMPAIVDYERLCSPHENTKGLSSRKSGTIIMSLLNLEKYESNNKDELVKSVDGLIEKSGGNTEYFVIFCSLLYNITWDDDIFKYLFIACGRSVLKSEDKGLFDYFESTKNVLLDEVMIETGDEEEEKKSRILKAYLEQNKEYLKGLLMGIEMKLEEEERSRSLFHARKIRDRDRAAEAAAEKVRADNARKIMDRDRATEAAAEKVRADNAKAEAALLSAHPARQPNRLPPASEQARSDDAAAAAARVAADEPFHPRNSRQLRRDRMLKGALA